MTPKEKTGCASTKNKKESRGFFPSWTLTSPPVGAFAVLFGIVLWHSSDNYLAAHLFGIHPQEFIIGFTKNQCLWGMTLIYEPFLWVDTLDFHHWIFTSSA